MRDPFRTWKTAWVDFSEQVGGEYTSYTHNMGARVVVTEGPWKIIFTDFYDLQVSQRPGTVITANFVTTHNLRFSLHRASILVKALNVLGLHDIQIGDAAFDSAYFVKGSDPAAIKSLFEDAELRSQLMGLPPMEMCVVDHEGWYTQRSTPEQGMHAPPTREDVDVLYCFIQGDIWEAQYLLTLNKLMSSLLHGLVRIGAALEEG